jgi:hypothetical protein
VSAWTCQPLTARPPIRLIPSSSNPMMEGPWCRFRREARARERHRHCGVDSLKALDPERPIREADLNVGPGTSGADRPRLNSEQFRSAPRTSRPCRGSLRVPHRLIFVGGPHHERASYRREARLGYGHCRGRDRDRALFSPVSLGDLSVHIRSGLKATPDWR